MISLSLALLFFRNLFQLKMWHLSWNLFNIDRFEVYLTSFNFRHFSIIRQTLLHSLKIIPTKKHQVLCITEVPGAFCYSCYLDSLHPQGTSPYIVQSFQWGSALITVTRAFFVCHYLWQPPDQTVCLIRSFYGYPIAIASSIILVKYWYSEYCPSDALTSASRT